MRRPLPFALWVALGLVVDQVSKAVVMDAIPRGASWPLWSGVLHFTPARNTGVAFSFFKGHPALILALTAAASAVLGVWYAKSWRDAPGALIVVQGLLLVGALGNLADRLWLGAVRDFIDFRLELPWIGRWATFNVADICICAGVALFVCLEFFPQGKAAARNQNPEPASQESKAKS